MDIHAILKQLPHRYPFLLVDRVVELESNKRIRAIKNVTFNEPYFMGHFPGRPVMPGVLMLAPRDGGGCFLVASMPNDPGLGSGVSSGVIPCAGPAMSSVNIAARAAARMTCCELIWMRRIILMLIVACLRPTEKAG